MEKSNQKIVIGNEEKALSLIEQIKIFYNILKEEDKKVEHEVDELRKQGYSDEVGDVRSNIRHSAWERFSDGMSEFIFSILDGSGLSEQEVDSLLNDFAKKYKEKMEYNKK